MSASALVDPSVLDGNPNQKNLGKPWFWADIQPNIQAVTYLPDITSITNLETHMSNRFLQNTTTAPIPNVQKLRIAATKNDTENRNITLDNPLGQFLYLAQTFVFGALAIGYFHRRRVRLSTRWSSNSNWLAVATICLPVILVAIVQLVASVILDTHWDRLQNQYSLPTASEDIAMLVKLSGAGLTAWVLAVLMGFCELHDWLRYKNEL